MSGGLYAMFEALVLAAMLMGCALYLCQRLMPAAMVRLRLHWSLRLGRPANPLWLRWLGSRLAPPVGVARGGCGGGGCGPCGGCGR